MMISKYCPITGEHFVIITIPTVRPAKTQLITALVPYNLIGSVNFFILPNRDKKQLLTNFQKQLYSGLRATLGFKK